MAPMLLPAEFEFEAGGAGGGVEVCVPGMVAVVPVVVSGGFRAVLSDLPVALPVSRSAGGVERSVPVPPEA